MEKDGIKGLLFVFMIFFIVGLFFLSPNITGNSIGSLNASGSNLLGIGFVVLGILGYYFVYRFLGSYL